MANIMGQVENHYKMFDTEKEFNVDTWPMMESPGPMLCIVGCYLAFVVKVGPKMMEKRPAFQLTKTLIVYNAIAVLVSLWLTIMPLLNPGIWRLLFPCKCTSRGAAHIMELEVLSKQIWWYYIAKIFELLDTVFFVLRKKQNQLTFLHIYHHAVTLMSAWFHLKSSAGEHGVMITCLNSFVHVIMYSYYLLAALGPQYKKYVWWKQYMTTIQLVQFGIILCYMATIATMECKLSKGFTYFFITNSVIFLCLFGNFYRQSYMKKKV